MAQLNRRAFLTALAGVPLAALWPKVPALTPWAPQSGYALSLLYDTGLRGGKSSYLSDPRTLAALIQDLDSQTRPSTRP